MLMNNQKLFEQLEGVADHLEGNTGNWKFKIDAVIFFCLTDEFHNRMRIIAPIAKIEDITEEHIKKCMEANFHTALDIRYAFSDGIVWAAFIHPLKELTDEQVQSAVKQVYSGVKTFGSYYSGGSLSFPTKEDRDARNN